MCSNTGDLKYQDCRSGLSETWITHKSWFLYDEPSKIPPVTGCISGWEWLYKNNFNSIFFIMNFKIIIFLWLLLDVIVITIIIPAFSRACGLLWRGVRLKLCFDCCLFAVCFSFLLLSLVSWVVNMDMFDSWRAVFFGTFLSTLILLLSRQYQYFSFRELWMGLRVNISLSCRQSWRIFLPDEATKSKTMDWWSLVWTRIYYLTGDLILILKFGHIRIYFQV